MPLSLRAFAISAGVLAVVALACIAVFVPSADSYGTKIAALPRSSEACHVAGGQWRLFRESGQFACAIRTRDAGRSCRSSSDCQGVCIAAHSTYNTLSSNACSAEVLVLGCVDEADGANIRRICRDG